MQRFGKIRHNDGVKRWPLMSRTRYILRATVASGFLHFVISNHPSVGIKNRVCVRVCACVCVCMCACGPAWVRVSSEIKVSQTKYRRRLATHQINGALFRIDCVNWSTVSPHRGVSRLNISS